MEDNCFMVLCCTKSWPIGKNPDAGRVWGQEEKGKTEDEMAGWHHKLDRHEFEWTSGVGDVQGGLACCDSWGCKELDTTEQLNWTESQALSRGEAKDSALLSSRDAGLLEPPERWCWQRLRVEGDDRDWDGWMASLTWWTWVWASSGSWWWTRKPGIL